MNNRTKGITAILLSAFGFALMNLFIPLAGDLPTIQKSFFRNLIAFLVAFALLLKSNKKEEVKELHDVKSIPWKTLILRASLGTAGIFCNYYALDHLFISDASVLNKLAPPAQIPPKIPIKYGRISWICSVGFTTNKTPTNAIKIEIMCSFLKSSFRKTQDKINVANGARLLRTDASEIKR